MTNQYDVIVVGARCAGSPTAMLLARQGLRVLLVDRARFPSDTISSHLIHPPGIAALQRWGLLDQLVSTGCPAITRYFFDFGCAVLAGSPTPIDGISAAYGPRRTVLDALLVDAAVRAGVEVRQGYSVREILVEDGRVAGIRGGTAGGVGQLDRAPLVIGADGKHSLVARSVGESPYIDKPPTTAGYYAYFAGLPIDDFRVYVRPTRAVVVVPTHDNLSLVLVGWPRSEFTANKHDLDGNYRRSAELIPELAEQLSAATQMSPLVGTGDMLNNFRRPYGPGWALVGDAGYVKDPATAQGISDSFRDAELVAGAIAQAGGPGGATMGAAMAGYHRARDEAVKPMFDFTCHLAGMGPLPPFIRGMFRALQGNQDATDRFMGMIAGTVPVKSFFAPGNLGRVFVGGFARRVRAVVSPPGPLLARPSNAAEP